MGGFGVTGTLFQEPGVYYFPFAILSVQFKYGEQRWILIKKGLMFKKFVV